MLMEGGPKTEAELASELRVSKTAIHEAATAEETVVVVPGQSERTYTFRLRSEGMG
jgi:hypothetical protein